MTREEDKFKHLVQATFNTEAGAALLEELQARYCRGIFSKDALEMAGKAAQSDLIYFLLSVKDEQ